jgi:hypothetical protein
MVANNDDKLERVSLLTSDGGAIFKIEWKSRTTGDTPYAEFYSYEQMSSLCPLLSLKFLENTIFGREDNNFAVKFQCEGQNANERYQLIQHVINGTKKSFTA